MKFCYPLIFLIICCHYVEGQSIGVKLNYLNSQSSKNTSTNSENHWKSLNFTINSYIKSKANFSYSIEVNQIINSRTSTSTIFQNNLRSDINSEEIEYSTALVPGIIKYLEIENLIVYYGLNLPLQITWKKEEATQQSVFDDTDFNTLNVSRSNNFGKTYQFSVFSKLAPYYKLGKFQIGIEFNLGLSYWLNNSKDKYSIMTYDRKTFETVETKSEIKNDDWYILYSNYYSIGLRYNFEK